MKLICSTRDLTQALATVRRGISHRSTQPVQHMIHLEATEGWLRLVATDLDRTSIAATFPADVAETGATVVPPARLRSALVPSPGERVSLVSKNIGDTVDTLTVAAGGSKQVLRGMVSENFTQLPAVGGGVRFSLPQWQLAKSLKRVLFAASHDPTRPILETVLFRFGGGDALTLVATDTYRIAVQELLVPGVTVATESHSFLVYRQTVAELLRIMDSGSDEPVTAAFSDTQVRFAVGRYVVGGRLREGQYFNYPKVIPNSHERRVVVNTKALTAALLRVHGVAAEDASRVVFKSSTDGAQLLLTASAQDVGEATETVPMAMTLGTEFKIAFNGKYMRDALAAVCGAEDVTLELSGPLNSGVVRPASDAGDVLAGYQYVLMPMQII